MVKELRRDMDCGKISVSIEISHVPETAWLGRSTTYGYEKKPWGRSTAFGRSKSEMGDWTTVPDWFVRCINRVRYQWWRLSCAPIPLTRPIAGRLWPLRTLRSGAHWLASELEMVYRRLRQSQPGNHKYPEPALHWKPMTIDWCRRCKPHLIGLHWHSRSR